MPTALGHEEIRAVYDRLGRWHDLLSFYEDVALERLVAHGAFDRARRVVEFGCGTGKLAARLLARHLPPEATYQGFDVSPTMAALARKRLAPFGERARVTLTEGRPRAPVGDASCDRFIATYVLDLLSSEDARLLVRDAHRVLTRGGRLCLTGLTRGQGILGRAVQAGWELLYRVRPRLVGGCRPVQLLEFLEADWSAVHREVVCRFGFCSEVLLADNLGDGGRR